MNVSYSGWREWLLHRYGSIETLWPWGPWVPSFCANHIRLILLFLLMANVAGAIVWFWYWLFASSC